METEDKIKLCQAVTQAVLADLQVTDEERQLLDDLIERYGLDEEAKRQVFQVNIDDDPAELVSGISSIETKEELIAELAHAVAADGEVQRPERALLERVASALGIELSQVDKLVEDALSS